VSFVLGCYHKNRQCFENANEAKEVETTFFLSFGVFLFVDRLGSSDLSKGPDESEDGISPRVFNPNAIRGGRNKAEDALRLAGGRFKFCLQGLPEHRGPLVAAKAACRSTRVGTAGPLWTGGLGGEALPTTTTEQLGGGSFLVHLQRLLARVQIQQT